MNNLIRVVEGIQEVIIINKEVSITEMIALEKIL